MSCPDCFRGGKATGDPRGTIKELYGLQTYIAEPPSTSTSKSIIIFYTDAFGLELVNNKLLADAYAAATGFRVLVPDIIPGGPMSLVVLDLIDSIMAPISLLNIWGQAVRISAVARVIPHVIPFFYRATPSSPACFKPCLEYARKVRADLPLGAKLGVAGFCWGGYHSINLCSQATVEGGSEPLIDAEFCAHPSKLDLPKDVVEAVTKFKVPIAIAHARDDYALPWKQMEATQTALKEKAGTGDGTDGYHYQIEIYKDVPHGFAVRARPDNEVDGKAADNAKEQAIQWFKKWL
jgi:dienelactone hydrolase